MKTLRIIIFVVSSAVAVLLFQNATISNKRVVLRNSISDVSHLTKLSQFTKLNFINESRFMVGLNGPRLEEVRDGELILNPDLCHRYVNAKNTNDQVVVNYIRQIYAQKNYRLFTLMDSLCDQMNERQKGCEKFTQDNDQRPFLRLYNCQEHTYGHTDRSIINTKKWINEKNLFKSQSTYRDRRGPRTAEFEKNRDLGISSGIDRKPNAKQSANQPIDFFGDRIWPSGTGKAYHYLKKISTDQNLNGYFELCSLFDGAGAFGDNSQGQFLVSKMIYSPGMWTWDVYNVSRSVRYNLDLILKGMELSSIKKFGIEVNPGDTEYQAYSACLLLRINNNQSNQLTINNSPTFESNHIYQSIPYTILDVKNPTIYDLLNKPYILSVIPIGNTRVIEAEITNYGFIAKDLFPSLVEKAKNDKTEKVSIEQSDENYQFKSTEYVPQLLMTFKHYLPLMKEKLNLAAANGGTYLGQVVQAINQQDGSKIITGWACRTDDSTPIKVYLVTQNPQGKYTMVSSSTAARKHPELKASAYCKNREASWFQLKISKNQLLKLEGQIAYVYAEGPSLTQNIKRWIAIANNQIKIKESSVLTSGVTIKKNAENDTIIEGAACIPNSSAGIEVSLYAFNQLQPIQLISSSQNIEESSVKVNQLCNNKKNANNFKLIIEGEKMNSLGQSQLYIYYRDLENQSDVKRVLLDKVQ